ASNPPIRCPPTSHYPTRSRAPAAVAESRSKRLASPLEVTAAVLPGPTATDVSDDGPLQCRVLRHGVEVGRRVVEHEPADAAVVGHRLVRPQREAALELHDVGVGR